MFYLNRRKQGKKNDWIHLCDALAKKIGVSHTTVLRWRKREMMPSWAMIPAIEAATCGQVGASDFVPDASEHIGE